jgi:hypothetical protein
MASSEPAIRLTARLYEMRGAMKLLHGKKYGERVQHMRGVLERVATMKRELSQLECAIWLAKRCDPHDALERMLIFAAYVEMIEPTESMEDSKQ